MNFQHLSDIINAIFILVDVYNRFRLTHTISSHHYTTRVSLNGRSQPVFFMTLIRYTQNNSNYWG